MAYTPVGDIRKNVDSIYKLTILAARRAVDLSNGSQRLVEINSQKFSTIALEEIRLGKVRYKVKK